MISGNMVILSVLALTGVGVIFLARFVFQSRSQTAGSRTHAVVGGNGTAVAMRSQRQASSPTMREDAVLRHAVQEETRRAPQTGEKQIDQNKEKSGSQEQIARYFQEVAEQYKLPPLPSVVTQALGMLRDPNVDISKLGRVLANDVAIVGRILSLSRSPIYGLRNTPKTIQEAIPILGQKALRRILLTAGTQSLCIGHTGTSSALWDHSLATALAAEGFARKVGLPDPDLAFLAGLMHDIGQMVLLLSGPERFEQLRDQAQLYPHSGAVTDWEQEAYGFDHTKIGASVLYRWDIEPSVCSAVLSHHAGTEVEDSTSLNTILWMADYLTYTAELGFLAEPPPPPEDLLESYGCADGAARTQMGESLRNAFEEERTLLRLGSR